MYFNLKLQYFCGNTVMLHECVAQTVNTPLINELVEKGKVLSPLTLFPCSL